MGKYWFAFKIFCSYSFSNWSLPFISNENHQLSSKFHIYESKYILKAISTTLFIIHDLLPLIKPSYDCCFYQQHSIFDFASQENFVENLAKYARYFVTVMLGTTYI